MINSRRSQGAPERRQPSRVTRVRDLVTRVPHVRRQSVMTSRVIAEIARVVVVVVMREPDSAEQSGVLRVGVLVHGARLLRNIEALPYENMSHAGALCASSAMINVGSWVHAGTPNISTTDCSRHRSNESAYREKSRQLGYMFRSGADFEFWTEVRNYFCCTKRLQHRRNVVWQPSSCNLAPWSAELFCSSLGGRSLLYVGDSVSQQIFSELVIAIHAEGMAGCADLLTWASADTLVDKELGSGWNRGREWAWWVTLFKPDIIVAGGAGAHVYGESNYIWALASVAARLATLRTELGDDAPTFIWQTIPGAGCGPTLLDRLPSQMDPSFWLQMNASRFGAPLNYPAFEARNLFATTFWSSRAVPVLDLEPLHYRVDAHMQTEVHFTLRDRARSGLYAGLPFPVPNGSAWQQSDCMHFCQPEPGRGALNVVPRLLLHLFLTSPALVLPPKGRCRSRIGKSPPEEMCRPGEGTQPPWSRPTDEFIVAAIRTRNLRPR